MKIKIGYQKFNCFNKQHAVWWTVSISRAVASVFNSVRPILVKFDWTMTNYKLSKTICCSVFFSWKCGYNTHELEFFMGLYGQKEERIGGGGGYPCMKHLICKLHSNTKNNFVVVWRFESLYEIIYNREKINDGISV